MLVSHFQRIGSSDPLATALHSKHYTTQTASLHEDMDRRYSLARTSAGQFQNDLNRKDLFADKETSTKQQEHFYSQHDKPRVTDMIGRPDHFQSQEDRRRTVGGSPLQGLINEFRNNSLGSDLRKLKEAHQEIIEDLKSAIFRKKSKKPSKSPHHYPKTLNPNTKQENKDVGHPKDYGIIINKKPQTQTAAIKLSIPHEKYFSSDDITRTVKRYANEQQKKTIDITTQTKEKKREYRHNPEIAHHIETNVKSPSYKQIKKQLRELTKEDRQERMNEQIMSLRQAKIDLLKQLNQETSNYNHVMVENKRVLIENKHLKDQLRMQDTDIVQQLKKENRQLRQQLSKYESLMKPNMGSPKNHQQIDRVKEQLDQERNRYRSLVMELQQYRQLYGGLPRSTYPEGRTKKQQW